MWSNWLGKTTKSSLPEPTALQAQRARQIEQLRSFDSNVAEIQRDVEYRVSVSDASGISLHVILPPQFPQDRPIVRVSPKVSHPWVNDQMIVTGCAGINNFMVHSDLGKVVREVVEEFRRNPPSISPSSVPVGGSVWSSAPAVPSTYHGLYARQTTPQPTPATSRQYSDMATVGGYTGYPLTEDPMTFPELATLGPGECQELAENDDKLLEFLTSLPQWQRVMSDRTQLLQAMETRAKENISKKAILEEKKRIVIEKYDTLQDLRRHFDDNSRRQDELHTNFDLQLIQDNLKVAALQAEEQAEAVADQFLEGKITVEEFHKSYMPQRTLSHLRRAKEEKISQGIHDPQRTF